MGKCHKCNKEITLVDNETTCPSCGSEQKFHCHECGTGFYAHETHECKWCGYFYCTMCGVCGQGTCPSLIHYKELKGKTIGEAIQYFAEVKKGLQRRVCSKGVPISYAKGKIYSYLRKMRGIQIKDKEDQDLFIERYNKMLGLPVATTWTVEERREKGSKGQELREVSIMGVCHGQIKLTRKFNIKTNSYFDSFTRINEEPCNNYDESDLEKERICKKCNTTYKAGTKYCSTCISSKGKRKGQPFKLINVKSVCELCQLNRKMFKPKVE